MQPINKLLVFCLALTLAGCSAFDPDPIASRKEKTAGAIFQALSLYPPQSSLGKRSIVGNVAGSGASRTLRVHPSAEATAAVEAASAEPTIPAWLLVDYYHRQAARIDRLRERGALDADIVDALLELGIKAGPGKELIDSFYRRQAADLVSVRGLPWVSDKLIVDTLANKRNLGLLALNNVDLSSQILEAWNEFSAPRGMRLSR